VNYVRQDSSLPAYNLPPSYSTLHHENHEHPQLSGLYPDYSTDRRIFYHIESTTVCHIRRQLQSSLLWLNRTQKYNCTHYLLEPNAHTKDRPLHPPSVFNSANKIETMDELKKTGLSLALVYGVHYLSTQVYGGVCVPSGFHGILSGVFTTASPWCHLILNTMQMTESSYGTMILTGVTRLVVGSAFGSGPKNEAVKVE